ncbi:MAG: TlpA disulfide reductase family protein [Chitinophagales bacterium]
MLLVSLGGPEVKVVNFQQYENIAEKKNNDTLYVVNFWATWCKPCVAEMPYFEAAAKKFSSERVKVVFIDLNYPREKEQVQNFINEKKVTSEVYLLDAGNPNNWIPAIDSEWSGAIPATVMFKNGKKIFFREGEMTANELDSIIKNKTGLK